MVEELVGSMTSQMSMEFPDLSGKRIDLVKINGKGLYDMHEYSTKPEFYEYLEFDPFKTIEETRTYLDKLITRSNSETGHYWFIKLRNENKIIGTFGLLDIDWRKGVTEIGYGLSPAFWGQGYFKEALQMVSKYLFEKLNFHRVWAKTQSDNLHSIRALENNGFIREGLLRDYYLSSSGRRHHAVVLSILRDEYFSLHGHKHII